ncbi:polyadenylate-binding protein-interacting protein 2 [Halyomorpha halys]|uniref:polyadenylate-binding protein-interacting protein 2 n=1 Tax=Halyomorpha halys TaxID=286706 RepID=UPI0006D4E93C|nr:polyadenylate-binding protein-interacting protein 2-like [Halyomorpha halys]
MADKLLVIIMTIPPVILEITTFSSQKKEKETSLKTDFTEYLWMENEEEFDEEVLKQLEEEALMDDCMEAMLEEEMMMMNLNEYSNLDGADLEQHEDLVEMSLLNPNAAEFVPQSL